MENNDFTSKILEKTKLNIAMSEFGKEYQMKKEKKIKDKYFYMKKAVAAVIVVTLLAVGGVQAKNMIIEYENKNVVYASKSISDAVTNGYVQDVDMEYAYSDGVGLKIDSFFMSENNINIIFNFKTSEGIEIDQQNMEFAYILYNENNEIYYTDGIGIDRIINKDFAKEKKLKVEYVISEDRWSSSQEQCLVYKKDNVIISDSITAKESFPKAKKLCLKVYGIGYGHGYPILGGDYKAISKSTWNIELDIPDKFYSAIGIDYKVKENVKNFRLEKFYVTDTSTIFIAHIKGINSKTITLIDENGNEYKSSNGYFYTGEDGDRITAEFPVNKNMLTDKMYIKAMVDGEEKTIELIQK